MRFGIRPTEGGSNHELTLRQVKYAEELGFHSAFVGQHHGFDDHGPSPAVTLSSLATITRRIVLGSQILILPQAHPLQVAEDFLVLDQISKGRVVLGVGIGWDEAEFYSFNVLMQERGQRMREGLALIKSFWSQERAEFSGQFYRLKGIRRSPPPVQDPHPPIWVGGRTKSNLRLAVEFGDAYIPDALASLDQLKACYTLYDALMVEAGRDPNAVERPLQRHLILGKTREAAWESARDFFLPKYSAQTKRKNPLLALDFDEDFNRWVANRFILGTPEDCIAGLLQLETRFGVNHVILRLVARDASEWFRQVELFARDVLPVVVSH